MRLWILAVMMLVLASISYPLIWGEKDITRIECTVTDGRSHDCDPVRYLAEYKGLEMTWMVSDGDHSGTQYEVWKTREASYFGAIPHEGPLDFALRYGLAVAWMGAALLAVATGLHGFDRTHYLARPMGLTGAATVIGGQLLFLAGMGIHSGTWAGTNVGAWQPGIGVLMVPAMAVAIAFWLRWTNQAEGQTLPPLPSLDDP